jgi:long-subunit acyl-CoA synthetase (AMP-forming)
MVKKVHLADTPFSIETNTLTPTFKVKRNEAAKFYKDILQDLYK